MRKKLPTRTLLIVDDEELLRDVLVETLECLGITIECAPDGLAALEFLKTTEVEAVLCDINMPNMSGLDLLRHLNASDIPSNFVFLTAYGKQECLMQALRLGATDFILKPFETSELVEVVARAIEIGHRRLHIEDLRKKPGNEAELKKAERMVSLFKLINDSKRKMAG